MPSFKKKPIIVEAVRVWDPMTVHTPEGAMSCKPGDWLVTGAHGEKYFVADLVFRETYEPVDALAQRMLFETQGYSISERGHISSEERSVRPEDSNDV